MQKSMEAFYWQGFLTKCAEAGLDEEQTLKLAQYNAGAVPGAPAAKKPAATPMTVPAVAGSPSAPGIGAIRSQFPGTALTGGAGLVPSFGQNPGGSATVSPINMAANNKRPLGTAGTGVFS